MEWAIEAEVPYVVLVDSQASSRRRESHAQRGMLRKLVAKVADSLLEPYEQLLAMLPDEERLNVDETGHKENGKPLWTWCFRATLFTVYKISPSRGSGVLIDVLGEEFDGVLGSFAT